MTQAAPGHVALHVLHAGGGLDGNAAGVEDDTLANEGDRLGVLVPGAAPAHDRKAAFARAALAHAQKRAHAQLGHFLRRQDFHFHAQLFKLGGLGGELDGAEHVGRFVDEIARQHDAAGDPLGGLERLLGGLRIGALDGDGNGLFLVLALLLVLAGILRLVLVLGLVAVELVGTQHHAGGKGRGEARLQIALAGAGDYRHRKPGLGDPGPDAPAQRHRRVLVVADLLGLGRLRHGKDARGAFLGGGVDVQRARRAGEIGGGGRLLEPGGGGQRRGRLAKFQFIAHQYDRGAGGDVGERLEADFG